MKDKKDWVFKDAGIKIVEAFGVHIGNGATVFGLGDDQKVYAWDHRFSEWVPQWYGEQAWEKPGYIVPESEITIIPPPSADIAA